ncbi:MAG TPA: signal peptide peptidase SppA [Planctomycetes bacterium]|nr:signal peptide peptidase SppA [Planctomycetota bacterium]
MEQARPRKRRVLRKLILLLVLAGIAAWVCVRLFGTPGLPAHAILVLRVGDALPIAPADGFEALLFGQRGPALPALHTALARGARDARVEGVFLDLRDGSLGLADARELRRLLIEFRKERKPVIAYADDMSLRAWYVASACDKVVMNPAGYLQLTGTSLRVLLFGDLLKRLKLKADLERVGRYKTAFETMTDNKLSPPSREALQRISDAVWEQLIGELAEGRSIEREALEELIDQGPLPARAAEEKKLVDALKWRDELDAYVKGAVGAPAELVSFERYAAGSGRGAAIARIAYLPLAGTILAGGEGRGLIAADAVVAQLGALRDDPSIAAIVVRVDSPGGDAIASASLYRAIRSARLKKPVVVSMGAAAASGGYYLAAAADYIVAQPFTLTGSVGIFGGKIVADELLAWAEISQETFRHGAFAGLYDPFEPLNDTTRAAVRRELEDMYERFVRDVAEGRNLPVEAVEAVAGGRVWTGDDACRHKLVDALGGLDTALAKAKELARIEGDAALILWPPAKAWYEQLVAAERDPDGLGRLRALKRALCAGRPLALLPFGMSWD